MSQYRKKPVVIEAFRFRDRGQRGQANTPEWLVHALLDGRIRRGIGCLLVTTLEGEMKAGDGDWIIKGVMGELYPCKPDIFDATYEALPEAEGSS